MGRGKDRLRETIAKIEVLLKLNYSDCRILSICKASRNSVQNVKNRLRMSGNPLNRRKGRCGRKNKTTKNDDRILIRNLRRDPMASSANLKNDWKPHGVNVDASTVRRRLTSLGCKSKVMKKVPVRTAQMKKRRLEFAMKYRNWTSEEWSKVRQCIQLNMVKYGCSKHIFHSKWPSVMRAASKFNLPVIVRHGSRPVLDAPLFLDTDIQ